MPVGVKQPKRPPCHNGSRSPVPHGVRRCLEQGKPAQEEEEV